VTQGIDPEFKPQHCKKKKKKKDGWSGSSSKSACIEALGSNPFAAKNKRKKKKCHQDQVERELLELLGELGAWVASFVLQA
jgi:hypothetical protein